MKKKWRKKSRVENDWKLKKLFLCKKTRREKWTQTFQKRRNVESHEAISLYIINDVSSNRWDLIINFAICFPVNWIFFSLYSHFTVNWMSIKFELIFPLSPFTLLSEMSCWISDFNDFLFHNNNRWKCFSSFLFPLGISFQKIFISAIV